MKDIKKNLLTENLKDRAHYSLLPAVKPIEDLCYKKEIDVNGWFVIGHYDIEGELINFMLHFLYMNPPGGFPNGISGGVDVNVSMTNETTGEYMYHDAFYTNDEITVEEREGGLYFKTPHALMEGTLDNFHVEGDFPEGSICVDMTAYGGVIYNGGIGTFPTMFGGMFNQYSVPNLRSNGKITLKGHNYEIKDGKSWLDRQWQNQPPGYLGTSWKWGWMDINLDNGDVISMWDMRGVDSGVHGAWATILHPDGNQTTTWMKDWLEGASDFWKSPETGRVNPTKFELEIPEFDCTLEVVTNPKEQEIVATTPRRHKYEGASKVRGTYKGEKVTGYCYSELVGDWL